MALRNAAQVPSDDEVSRRLSDALGRSPLTGHPAIKLQVALLEVRARLEAAGAVVVDELEAS